MFRSHLRKLALGGCLLQSCFSTAGPPNPVEPDRLPLAAATVSTNQQIAENIARDLNQSGRLRRYAIDVTFQDGIAVLAGTVADQPQREEAIRLVQGMSGVAVVARSADDRRRRDADPGRRDAAATSARADSRTGGRTTRGSERHPGAAADLPGADGWAVRRGPPKMPPYAWPTYAPYNNYSRVALPQSYPYQAFPFIGPCYPFPKIPPSWRSVKLEWEDGHWWFSTHSTKHDLWRMRYW